MRRIALVAIAGLGAVFLPLTSAAADPSPAPSIPVPSASPGTSVCTLNSQLSAIVGVTATASGYAVVDKPNNSLSTRVYQLNGKCGLATVGPINYSGGSGVANNPSDIQVSADGSTYWVADAGDDVTNPTRPTIALWKIPVNKSRGTLYRFQFPSGDGPYDSDAMLMNGTTPFFITHPSSGPAGIYTPASAMSASATVPLRKVGEFTPQKTGTANKLGLNGQLTVTGGAVSPDGKRIVLRTYSDAYEWDVPDGDIAKALTTTTPRITPLPNEDGGEAITYTPDGKYFLTVNDTDSKTPATMLRYTPDKAVAVPHPTEGASLGGSGDGQSWFSKLSLDQVIAMVAAIGVIGLGMVAAGVIGIRVARKRRPADESDDRSGIDDAWAPEEQPVAAAARAAGPGGVYGGGRGPGGRPPERGGVPPEAGYVNPGGGRPAQRGRAGTYPSSSPGGVYGAAAQPGGRVPNTRDGGTRDDRGRDGRPRDGRAREGGVYGGGRDREDGVYGGGRQGTSRQGGGRQGQQDAGRDGGRQGGTYSGGTYSSGGYEPPAVPLPPRGDGGIARSHRPGRPGRNAPPPRRGGGYAEEHDGFDDLRRLSE